MLYNNWCNFSLQLQLKILNFVKLNVLHLKTITLKKINLAYKTTLTGNLV